MQAYAEDPFNAWADQGCPTDLSAKASEFSEAMHSIKSVRYRARSNHLIKGLIDIGALSVLIGKPNDGKTFFALFLGFHIAAGQPVFGRKVPPIDDYAGPVLYIAGEGGRGIDNRIEALRITYPEMCATCEKDDLFILMKVMVDFCGQQDAIALVEAIERECPDPSFIVVDTLAMAFAGGDENSAKDMGQFIANCNFLRARTGAHVMVIHHSGKDASKGARGSNSLLGAVDTEISLYKSGAFVRAEATKQRDMPCDAIIGFTLKSVVVGIDGDGEEVTSAVVEGAEVVARKPKLTGQQKTAMKALEQAMLDHGEVKRGDPFPQNRQCVSLEHWRDCCDRMSLSSGEGESSKRTAFHKAKTGLQDKEIICVMDDHVWRVSE